MEAGNVRGGGGGGGGGGVHPQNKESIESRISKNALMKVELKQYS